jgi:hypothetical protein
MLSRSGSGSEAVPADKRRIRSTATYNGKRFHLHQVVASVPVGNRNQNEWIVVGLENGLELATPDFNRELQYPPGEIPNSIEPRYAETGEPIFGY